MFEAKCIKTQIEGFRGDVDLFEFNQDITFEGETSRYVVASTADAMFTGIETYLFLSDENGKVLSWLEMPGSARGETDRAEAIGRLVSHLNETGSAVVEW